MADPTGSNLGQTRAISVQPVGKHGRKNMVNTCTHEPSSGERAKDWDLHSVSSPVGYVMCFISSL